MSEAFRSGGFGMYLVAFAGLLMLASAVWYALGPRKGRLAPLVWSEVLVLAAGLAGTVTGFIATSAAVGQVAPDQRWIWIVGVGESLYNLAFALLLLFLGTLVAVVGSWLASALEKPAEARKPAERAA